MKLANEEGKTMSIRMASRPLFIIAMLSTAFVCANPYDARSDPLTASVAGTTWVGTDSDGDYYEYTFQTDGVLAYKSPNGFYKNGTWKQHGDGIYMETNHKFSERQGRIAGEHMEGDAWNVQGHKWTWAADEK
ncbi:MAG: hypothetical protein ABR863_01900 [Roseiarcus sp.]|jgi:outer membrane biogenesis lipoprotein LolB